MLAVISSPLASRTLTDTLAGESMAAAPKAHQAQLVHHDLPPDVYVRGDALATFARHSIISVMSNVTYHNIWCWPSIEGISKSSVSKQNDWA